MRLALDTNILIYAEGLDGPARRAVVVELLARVSSDQVVLPVQVLGEFFNVLIRKAGRSRSSARLLVLG